MPAPSNEFAFDPEAARRAAEHFARRHRERERKEQALKEHRYDEADTPERLAKRVRHLMSKVKEAMPRDRSAMPEALQEAMEAGRGTTPERVDNEFFERVLGETRDFLSVEFLEQAVGVVRSVGRITTKLGGGRVSFGTGFMVSPRLLMTNHHVLRGRDDAAASAVEFNYQRDRFGRNLTAERFELDPDTFFLNDKGLDFALVAVRGTNRSNVALGDFGYCPLIGVEGKISIGECVNIVQHPLGELKQVIIRQNKLCDLPDDPDWAAHYEADTEPGSSGSPVFNDQWEVVALHHSGVPKTNGKGEFLRKDGGVWRKGDDPAQLEWVANEGIRVSRLVAFLTDALRGGRVERAQRKLLEEVLKAEPAGPPAEARRRRVVDGGGDEPEEDDDRPRPRRGRTAGRAERAFVPRAGGATFTLPLRITVSVGGPEQGGRSGNGGTGGGYDAGGYDAGDYGDGGSASGAAEDLLERIEPDPDYDSRPGYDPDFLGFRVPMPKLANSVLRDALTEPGGRKPLELKYYHYSVLMNRRRRLAFVAAVNYDARAPFTHEREDGDKWFRDPRMKPEEQTDESHYRRNPLDRGHLARRADAAWGESAEEAKLANDDTFHFTNCSPQHEIFNQSGKATKRQLLLWGNLENHIAEQAAANSGKVTVFNGPIFGTRDPMHRDLAVPKEFWKVVVFESDAGKPRALAFVLSQAGLIKDLPEEEFDVGPYQPFQVKVRALEDRVKMDFGSLREADALEDEGAEESFAGGTEVVPIRSVGDMVL